MEGEATTFIRIYNVVLTKHDFIRPRTCEYYLHFNFKLLYPEKEFKEKNSKTFHGCMCKNKDSSNGIIEKGKE